MKFVIPYFLKFFPQDAGKSKPCENKVAVETFFLGMSSIWLRNGFSLSLCIRTTPMIFVSTSIWNRKGVNYNLRTIRNIFPCMITYTYKFRGWMNLRVEFAVFVAHFFFRIRFFCVFSGRFTFETIKWHIITLSHQKYPSGLNELLYIKYLIEFCYL